MKKGTTIMVIVLSILLVGLYTVASTYSVIVDVIENNGIMEIVNKVTIRDLLTDDNGSYNQLYYDLKNELNATSQEANILMDSVPINDSFKIVLESIVEYKVNDNISAKLSNDELYGLITDSVLKTDNISDELKSRIINKASIYRDDISDYVYDIEVSMLGEQL